MPLDPSIVPFAIRLSRIKSRQLARVIPGADVLDLQQELLLEVVGGWARFDSSRGRAEAFIEHLMAQRCWKLRRHRDCIASRTKSALWQLDQTPVPDPCGRSGREREEAVRSAVARMPTQYRDACHALCSTDTVSKAARRLAIPRSTLDSLIIKIRHALQAVSVT